MAAEPRRAIGGIVQDRTEVGQEAVVPDHQLVELAARADVLVVEHLGRLGGRRPQQLQVQGLLDPGGGGLGTGEELADRGEAARQAGGSAGPRREGGDRAAAQIVGLAPTPSPRAAHSTSARAARAVGSSACSATAMSARVGQ